MCAAPDHPRRRARSHEANRYCRCTAGLAVHLTFVEEGGVFTETNVLPALSRRAWYALSGQPCHLRTSVARISGCILCHASLALSAMAGLASRNAARSSVLISAHGFELARASTPG